VGNQYLNFFFPGTSLYNEKKRESLRIIEKKEEKVREMNDLLKRDIEPQMEKLRKVNFFLQNCIENLG